ncbi:MAG: flavin reductase family protein [Bryobacteraceae bacterium]|nr:flavin reductase family protein [Bryobacteraceae bacterium]
MESTQPLTAEAFRRACGRFATGIAVVTTLDAGGAPVGLTVNSFTSVSLDPPLVLFCLDRASQALPSFANANAFSINILEESQRDLSQRFAAREADRFAGLSYRLGTLGAPVLPGVLAVLECRRHAVLEGGDHLIFLGEVIAADAGDGQPLLYFGGRYRLLGM